MKLKIKDMDIATGGPQIAIINEHDAAMLDLHYEDRVLLKVGRKKTVAITDIGESEEAVPKGRIGLFEEVLDALNAKNNNIAEISLEQKPESVSYIRKKLDGKELNHKEFQAIIQDIVSGRLSSIELAHFVAACYTRGMSMREITGLTKAMVETGERVKIRKKPVVDLHCIGGVPGNRTTMIAVPIAAAAGIIIPKTSSRAITSPSGTADTMECLAKVDLPIKKMKQVISKANSCIMWGGAINLAPADDKIIKVEHSLSIDAEGQMLASVMAKKYSVSSKHVLIDIPVGKHAKCKTAAKGRHLKKQFEQLGKRLGIKVKAVLTDGSQPVGNGIGPALEATDCIKVLQNKKDAPQDLRERALMLAGILLELGGKAKKGKGKKLAEHILSSGLAYKKMKQIIKLQGKNKTPKPGRFVHHQKAGKTGKITEINNELITKTARLAGAPTDKGAGVYLYKHTKEKVKKGEEILTIYSQNKQKMEYSKAFIKQNSPVKIS